MSSAHSNEPADSNSSYGRSNDETLYLAHSRNPHELSFGTASGYGQRSCDTVALPQVPSASTQYSAAASLYPGQTQSTYQSSPVATLGYFPPLNVSVTLPQMPFSQPVPLQIMVQPSVGVGNVPQLNISINLPQIPSAVHPSFPPCPGQLQIQYQPSSEPTLGNVLQSHDRNGLDQIPSNRLGSASTLVYHGQTQPRSFNTSFNSGQLYDSGILTQVLPSAQEPQHASQMLEGGLVSTSEICASYSMGTGQSQITKLPSFRSLFGSPTLSSRLVSTNESHCLSPNDSRPRLSPVYAGQHGSTYQPEQMYDHSILYQELRAGIEDLHTPRELNNDTGPTSEVYPFYPRDSDLNSSLKRTADEINHSGSEDSSGQSVTRPSFEDSLSPRKRLKEAYIASCVPEERMQSLAATTGYHDLHSPDTLVDGCGISQDQRMNLPAQIDRSIGHYEMRHDTSVLHGARHVRISGNPTFTNIGMSHVTNNSGAHDLEILTKFVSFDALHDSSVQDPDRRCHPGTRANVLSRLQAWTDDPSASENIVWIHGLPGAGKSSVAQTIIRKCDREKLVASFFFYRSDPSRNDGNRLFTTIAWQLASSIPGVKTCLIDSLTRRPDLPTKDVETQFEELIVQPFRASNDSASRLDLPLTPVVVIDGVDECTDENLQRRILEVIGNAIRDRRIPLRFLILSRPEAHIKEAVDKFECPTLCIDLDSIDNANHDIQRYFNVEFSRIGGERHFDTTWPGDRVIQRLVCNSSGQFVYASTIIKYVGDANNCAKAQLDVILGLRKRPSASPFAPLDGLYTDILKRQPDQDFLKEVLSLLVACSSIKGHRGKGDLHEDFPKLLNVSEEEIGRKLRGMQSLLAFTGEKGHIDIHHRSFLDFLQDISRSGQCHISKRASSKRYLELITDTIIRCFSDVIDQPQCHDAQHLRLQYSSTSDLWRIKPELAVEDLREVLQPLVDLQDKLLNLPDFTSSRKLPPCNKCDAFKIMRNLLLHLSLLQAESYCIISSSTGATVPLTFEQKGDHYSTIAALPNLKMATENSVSDKDLDTDFASLLAYMRDMQSTSSPTASVLRLMHSLLRFDCVEIAEKVCSVLDAQNLVNLIDFMICDQHSLRLKNGPLCKAVHLIKEIYARVPVLPQSFVSFEHSNCNNVDEVDDDIFLSNRTLTAVVLDRFISSRVHGLTLGRNKKLSCVVGHDCCSAITIAEVTLSHSAKFQIMLELSKSIQYSHSIGVVLSKDCHLINILLDSEFRPEFEISCLAIEDVELNKYADESSVFAFGRLFYELYYFQTVFVFDYRCYIDQREIIVKRPSEPEIREEVWQLIQRCCAEDPESRPTIDEIVQEMESWGIESEISTPASSSSDN